MLYRTTCAILYKGDRVESGTELEMDEKVAANYGSDVVPSDGPEEEAEEVVVEEKALEEMSKDELAAKAEELDLAKSGSKADLIERITLHLEGGEVDQPKEEEVEE